jgi:hypothetical protein
MQFVGLFVLHGEILRDRATFTVIRGGTLVLNRLDALHGLVEGGLVLVPARIAVFAHGCD